MTISFACYLYLVPHDDDDGNGAATENMISTLLDAGLSKYMDSLTNLDDEGYKEHESMIEILIKNIISKYPQDYEQLTSSSKSAFSI